MSLADWNADLAELAGDFPSVLICNAVSIVCVASEVIQEVLIEADGDYDPTRMDVVATLSHFTGGTPADRDTVTLDGTSYYVDTVQTDTQTDTINLTLMRV